MAINYFQDTIFSTESTLSAPAVGTALQVAVNNTFSTRDYTFIVTVASVDTNVIVRLEGTNCELAKKIISDSGLEILPADSMLDAAKKVVLASKS